MLLQIILFFLTQLSQSSVWINELHYKGTSGPAGVEVAGPAYTDLSGWRFAIYDDTDHLSTVNLEFLTIENEVAQYGAEWQDIPSLPVTGPGGIALVDASDNVIDFVSYDGTITANGGPANGAVAFLIPTSEETGSDLTTSDLQLTGVGTSKDEMVWLRSIFRSENSINVGQALVTNCDDVVPAGVSIWFESGEPNYNCTWYDNRQNCGVFGSIPGEGGLSANEACCVCGGGTIPVPSTSPSISPSFVPSVCPTSSPSRSPTRPTSAYIAELTECQANTTQLEEDLADIYEIFANCDEMGISLMCSLSPTTTPVTALPTITPTPQPITEIPSGTPSGSPITAIPSMAPSLEPHSDAPSGVPTEDPTRSPETRGPSGFPTPNPTTTQPSTEPSDFPTASDPSQSPTTSPSSEPTFSDPSSSPTTTPSTSPSLTPTGTTSEPSDMPTTIPSDEPSKTPASLPTGFPTTRLPTPTVRPTVTPSLLPTTHPAVVPTTTPSFNPTCDCVDIRPPAASGGIWYDTDDQGGERYTCHLYARFDAVLDFCSLYGSTFENFGLTANEACCVCGGGSCAVPSRSPTYSPSLSPTETAPSVLPSSSPSTDPSREPTLSPETSQPSQFPSTMPLTTMPSSNPTTSIPSDLPSSTPSKCPSSSPSTSPSTSPSKTPSSTPSTLPSTSPSVSPTSIPTSSDPTVSPVTSNPTVVPSANPTETRIHCVDTLGYDEATDTYVTWTDAADGMYGCAWYESRNSTISCQLFSLYSYYGMNALEACCYCGGGVTAEPSVTPTDNPTPWVSNPPSDEPSTSPLTSQPSVFPTGDPSCTPTSMPTSSAPSVCPSHSPSTSPVSSHPTKTPSSSPDTSIPSPGPSFSPSVVPSTNPSFSPSVSPSIDPSTGPVTGEPTLFPTSSIPTTNPTCTCYDLVPPAAPGFWYDGSGDRYSCLVYASPFFGGALCANDGDSFENFGLTANEACCTCGGGSCAQPTEQPTVTPSFFPSVPPTSSIPSKSPTSHPSTTQPSDFPSVSPSVVPSELPSVTPSKSPDVSHPSVTPTTTPSSSRPSVSPTPFPTTTEPSHHPSTTPSTAPITNQPSQPPTTSNPSYSPITSPTTGPQTQKPSNVPTVSPFSSVPTTSPSLTPNTEAPSLSCYDWEPSPGQKWHEESCGLSDCTDFDCTWYAIGTRNECELFSAFTGYGVNAQFACCGCGGGIHQPTTTPTNMPSLSPIDPTRDPSMPPTTPYPSSMPSLTPDRVPTSSPIGTPSTAPGHPDPSEFPSYTPTSTPSDNPAASTLSPTVTPSVSPETSDPSLSPSSSPDTSDPSNLPSESPSTTQPSEVPSASPICSPTVDPSDSPETSIPTSDPSVSPTDEPTPSAPTIAPAHTLSPTTSPSQDPSASPTECDCYDLIPPGQNQWHDSQGPRYTCSTFYTLDIDVCQDPNRDYEYMGLIGAEACCVCGGGSCYTPSFEPSIAPTTRPTLIPSNNPSNLPSLSPIKTPTTSQPTEFPVTSRPTGSPSSSPSTSDPSRIPSLSPSSSIPTVMPSFDPSTTPTTSPSYSPTTSQPTRLPSVMPSYSPLDATCAERVALALNESAECAAEYAIVSANLTTCLSNTVDSNEYNQLLEDIDECEQNVTDLTATLEFLENGPLYYCDSSLVYVDVLRSEYSFFSGVYEMIMDSSGVASFVSINNETETILQFVDNNWYLENGRGASLSTPGTASETYPPYLDQWTDSNGLFVIIELSCHTPQVVSDCPCAVTDLDEETLDVFAQTCDQLATFCNDTLRPLVIQFCPQTCGITSWGDVLVDSNAAMDTYNNQLQQYPSTCRNDTAFCEFAHDTAYQRMCPVAAAECRDISDVCTTVCDRRRLSESRRRLQDCSYATVTVYHSSYNFLDGVYVQSGDNWVLGSNTLSMDGSSWNLGSVLSFSSSDAVPPTAANWLTNAGGIVVVTIECSETSLTYDECQLTLSTLTDELSECENDLETLDAAYTDCTTNCADNQAAGEACEARLADAEPRSNLAVPTTTDPVTNVDNWYRSKFVNSGLTQEQADRLFVFEDDELVYLNDDGTYTRTCVGYSVTYNLPCPADELVCQGSQYGYAGSIGNRIVVAMSNTDNVHSDCPTRECTVVTGWWADEIDGRGLDSSRICTIGDAFYYVTEAEYVYTCISFGDETDGCPNNNIICGGTSAGLKTYGWPGTSLSLLETALAEPSYRYPYCPGY